MTGVKVNASGATGGGLVRIGGAFQGGKADPSNPLYQAYVGRWGALPPVAAATTVTIDAGSKIDVSARNSGDGGTAIVWSNERTVFAGSILARGGLAGGNGGFVETSGKLILQATGSMPQRRVVLRVNGCLIRTTSRFNRAAPIRTSRRARISRQQTTTRSLLPAAFKQRLTPAHPSL